MAIIPHNPFMKPIPPQDSIPRKHRQRSNSSTAIQAMATKNSRKPCNYFSVPDSLHAFLNSGQTETALHLFHSMKTLDPLLWNIMIKGYVQNGFFHEAIEFYYQMQSNGVIPDHFTYPFVLKACARLSNIAEGKKVHCKLVKTGLDTALFVANSLITMYCKCKEMHAGELVFDEMPERDIVSWNSLIAGYASNAYGHEALLCLGEMQLFGFEPDRFTLLCALPASTLDKSRVYGKEIHCKTLRLGFLPDPMLETSLLDMYFKCRDVRAAEGHFGKMSMRNSVAWNTLISGYARNKLAQKAIDSFSKMQMQEKLCPDPITMVNLLPACAHIEALLPGKSIHGFSLRKGFLSLIKENKGDQFCSHLVLETALLDTYAKCKELEYAQKLFERMVEKNLVSCNAMIAGFAQNGQNKEAIALFHSLWHVPMEPDATTIASVLSAYGEIASLREGNQIHGYVVKSELGLDTFILNSLVYMYAKCGNLQLATRVFDGIQSKDVVSLNVIIMAYGIHGYGHDALDLFSMMKNMGITPNGSTFVSVLTSCSHSGMVDEGWKHFNSMQKDYEIDPWIEHYACMVDLLGRIGCLDQAEIFVRQMPTKPTPRIWGSLLKACRFHGHIELAERVAKNLLKLDHDNTGCYILLSNMYAAAGRWEDVEEVRLTLREKGLEKTRGCNVVELSSETCSFLYGERDHPESETIYRVSGILSRLIGELAYSPGTKFRLQDIGKKRANTPTNHSIRLALSLGLISSTIGTPILIRKNVRLCGDCHHALKMISEKVKREIIVRDPRLFHHFRDGYCCCADYW
ncbi:pentatricopeptide repeat-containing protein At4g35130, chloroplastic [Amborella trichopoda]|uniref:pentatricopeptide repeat-containing protein At4g35130, chloroplastic n=1 Tax=Amborella trichopoda TaxID=13333 RepID=UPI0009BDF141|nr:pentatricopeptide repeat-containing protein At4g35130, chloroplastic [Amborella trichopoda]|eukprot:XP_011623945.2 pentatricopeptide repeat-containing protein At4g35130, chloroplastic [Amborella trichopoda]